MKTGSLFWFRRDLRVDDNAGLSQALQSGGPVHCAFVFDEGILGGLAASNRRVGFLHESLAALAAALEALGGGLICLRGNPAREIPALAQRLQVRTVFANEDYEPAARQRDQAVAGALAGLGIHWHGAKDQVIFARDEVLTREGRPYTVFTPFSRAWRARLTAQDLAPWPVAELARQFARPTEGSPVPTLAELGFAPAPSSARGITGGSAAGEALLDAFLRRIDAYRQAREMPAEDGGSALSVHNRFGTLSIRRLVGAALAHTGEGADTWLSELIWREFFFQVLWHHPHVAAGAFRREYDAIAWPNDPALFSAWCEGRTGYPIVDAGMRQLATTGALHNRVRMIVASFLTKDLLVDWRWGEAHFARHLNDHDQAANNGGWQWAASTGCDAQPYFRIFNPELQSRKFDPQGRYIRNFVPALRDVPDRYIHVPGAMSPIEQAAAGCVVGKDYPAPVVIHGEQREKALALYSAVVGKGRT